MIRLGIPNTYHLFNVKMSSFSQFSLLILQHTPVLFGGNSHYFLQSLALKLLMICISLVSNGIALWQLSTAQGSSIKQQNISFLRCVYRHLVLNTVVQSRWIWLIHLYTQNIASHNLEVTSKSSLIKPNNF